MYDNYKNLKVFITGHTGFKGSWLNLWLEEIGADVAGYSLPPHEISHFNLLKLKSKNYFSDINDYASLLKALREFKPDIVFHLAAQSLVRESYKNPIKTFDTNVTGSLKVYSACLEAGVKSIVSVTTDKVYENQETMKNYTEESRLGGLDPYSSSKVCMEIMTSSFRKSFLEAENILLATARTGNVIGGGDWANERLIPDLVRSASLNQVANIRNPQSIRPWQYVLDPLRGYLTLGEKLIQGNAEYATAFNFGPNPAQCTTVQELCDMSAANWNKINIKIEKANPTMLESNILLLDSTKAKKKLNWEPLWDIKTSSKKTIEWYKNYYEEKTISSKNCLTQYLNDLNLIFPKN